MTAAARCLDPGCLDGPTDDEPRPRWAQDMQLLCMRCMLQLERRLAELPAHATALRAVLGGISGSVRGENKPTKGSPPVPLNIAAHDHLTAMQATVASWVRLVCEERGLRGPDRPDLGLMSAWLLSQLDWLLQHPAVGDLADEVRDLTRTADGLSHLTRKPTRAGVDCFQCASPLVRRVVDGLEEDRLSCHSCGQTYDDGQYLMALKAAAWEAARVEVDGETWATPASLAHDLGLREQTIREWRRREVIRSRRIGGIVFVHVADVEARHQPKGMTA